MTHKIMDMTLIEVELLNLLSRSIAMTNHGNIDRILSLMEELKFHYNMIQAKELLNKE